jgi:hypothetical protein
MNTRFGLWNIRSLYREGFFVTVSKELATYWRVVALNAGEYTFFYGEGNENH